MPTATATKPAITTPRPSITAAVAKAHADTQRDAGRRWLAWVEAAATSADIDADPAEIIATARTLGLPDAGAALARDADIVRRVRDAEARASAIREAVARDFAPFGGAAGVRARMAELRRELRKLEVLSGIDPRAMEAGRLRGEAARLRRGRPDLFPTDTPKRSTSKGRART